MLKNLNAILGKAATHAETKKFDFQVLLQSRLAPDQFPLIQQIQFVTDTAKFCAAYLSGTEAPVHDDKETTLSELTSRIDGVSSYLNKFSAQDFVGAEERKVRRPNWEGKYLTGHEFAMMHALPNLYFHMTTAYSILRHNGVDIGKKDFSGELPYKRGQEDESPYLLNSLCILDVLESVLHDLCLYRLMS